MKPYIAALIGLLVLSTAAFAEPIVIVNENVAIQDLSEADAAKIFLGKKKSWDSGGGIVAATLEGGAVHDAFIQQVVKKSNAQFATYWKKLVFTGRGQAPKSFASEADLAAFVARTPGAIGYIDAATPHPGAKAVPVR
jgi:ABC-type phosphate transport system substrate-binding protein